MTKIFIAGHKGMVGSAIHRQLLDSDVEIITADRKDLDLTNQLQVSNFFIKNSFDQVYLCAAKVGGIYANNTYPADFIYQNLMIQNNVIHHSYINGVKKLLFLGSSCIYPRLASQPMKENALLSGYLEPTNEPYAIAKITGIKMCESYNRQFKTDYRSVMPTNLYGPGDNYHQENSHVIPALIQKVHIAKSNHMKEVNAWGSGKALREFLYVDDMARASVFIMNLDDTPSDYSHINVGSGIECSIKELVETISEVIGFKGNIVWDDSKPDGTPRKLMDSSKLSKLGWAPKFNLKDGIAEAYDWYLSNIK